MLRRLVIATHNKGKAAEIAAMIAPFGIEVLSAADVKLDEPEETGCTFAENAGLKARHAASHCQMAALADDSGLVIPAIGGAPGVYSARWAGPDKDFSVAFERIRNELGSKPRDAYFACVLALAVPGEEIEIFEGRCEGTLTFPPRGTHGFGYDPIFIPKGHDITFGEMEPKEKNRISHRSKAFSSFLAYLKNHM